MRIGFYYHIPISRNKQTISMPSYLGVFIDSLSKEVDYLVLVMHEAEGYDKTCCDYNLLGKNISWINLGKKTTAWHRAIFHNKLLRKPLSLLNIDFLIVRSPTPLAPYFSRYIGSERIIFMVVGDYEEGIQSYIKLNFKNILIKIYLKRFEKSFQQELSKSIVFVNSRKLFDKYQKVQPRIFEIKTTTLSESDFYYRDDWSWNENKPLKVLYTGRLVSDKGLDDILLACVNLNMSGKDIEFHLAGITVKGEENYIEKLISKGVNLGFNGLKFHGLKTVGNDLNKLYRECDIYVLASKNNFEGFPRTLWEAMANGLPIIATKVGGIPHLLNHEKSALLIEPNNFNQIIDSVEKLIYNKEIRTKIIQNSYKLSMANTLEYQSKNMVKLLESFNSINSKTTI